MKSLISTVAMFTLVVSLIGCQGSKPAAAGTKEVPATTQQPAAPAAMPVDNTPQPITLYVNDQEVPMTGSSTSSPAQSMARIRFSPGLQVRLFKNTASKLVAFPLSEEQKRNGLAFLLQELTQDADWFFITSEEKQLQIDERMLQELVSRLPPLQIPKSQLVRPLVWRIYNIERTAQSWELPGLSAHLKATVEICHAPFSMQLLVNKPGQLSQYEFVPGTGNLTPQHRLQLRFNTHYKSHLAIWLLYRNNTGINNMTQIFPAPGVTLTQHLQEGQTILIPEQANLALAETGKPEFYLLATGQSQFLADFTNWLQQQGSSTPTVTFSPGVAWSIAPYPHVRLELHPQK